jgi:hypothetical protein
VTKITESLDRVIATRMQGAAPDRKRAKGKTPSLDGPGLPGASEHEQASIDALFRDN